MQALLRAGMPHDASARMHDTGVDPCRYVPAWARADVPTFRAMRWADGPIWIVCRKCRRYIELAMTTDVADRRITRTTFTCTVCGGEGHIANEDPASQGYRLDPRDNAQRRRRSSPGTLLEPLPDDPFDGVPRWRPTF